MKTKLSLASSLHTIDVDQPGLRPRVIRFYASSFERAGRVYQSSKSIEVRSLKAGLRKHFMARRRIFLFSFFRDTVNTLDIY